MKVSPSVGIIVFKNEKVLLVRHNEKAGHLTGVYGLPAGRVNSNEKEIAAARRELEEETDLKPDPNSLVEFPNNYFEAVIERKGGEKVLFPWRVFLCTSYKGEIKATEEATPVWVDIEKLDNYKLLPNIKQAVQNALIVGI
jgi:ADP-ribose pyrophosphatase YjhB (NUDIX family)